MVRLPAATVGLIALVFCGAVAVAQARSGVVQRVVDGDTIIVSGVGTVRLIGIDTPETVDPRKPVEYFGQEASAFAKRLAEGRTVRLELEGAEKDKYGRTLAYVYLADGTFLNAEMIRQGFAHAYTTYPFSKMEEFRALQREAMAHSRGLWAPEVERASNTASQTVAPEVRAAIQVQLAERSETVYATKTGTKYHRAGCRHLSRSQIPLSLKDAVALYGPCSVCKPPVLAAVASDAVPAAARPGTASAPMTPAAARSPAASGRCQATTKKGAQCSRNAQAGRSYCWQH